MAENERRTTSKGGWRSRAAQAARNAANPEASEGAASGVRTLKDDSEARAAAEKSWQRLQERKPGTRK